MAGNLFAAGMIAMLSYGIVVLARAGRRPKLAELLVGVLFAITCFLVMAILTPSHYCKAGKSLSPEFLGAWLAGLVFVVVPARRKIRLPSIVVLLASGFALSIWSVDLVHLPGYVGNKDYASPRVALRLLTAEKILEFESSKNPELVLPEGWMEDVVEEDYEMGSPCTLAELGNYWHTWFTRLFRVEKKQVGIWCPGGPVSDCFGKLEIRERETGSPDSLAKNRDDGPPG